MQLLKKYLLLVVCIIISNSVHPQIKSGSPNIIIIFTDDLGYGDLSVYGHPTIRTPQLDRMAADGMRFTQFYVAAAVCTPSRAGLLTGRYPVRTGLVHGIMRADVLFPNDDNGLAAEEVTIAEVLKQKSYATMAIGKWHLGHLPQYLPTTQGFDEYYGIPYSNDMDFVPGKDGKPGYWNVPLMHNEEIIERPAVQPTLTKRYTEQAIQFIRKNSGKPFFLYLAHSMPHVPIYASAGFAGKSKRGTYGDVVEELDWSTGELIKTLKELKIDKNTLVIFTSDNGPWLVQKQNGGSAGLLREGKGTTWEGGHRVPMIAWWPGTIPPGITQEEVATTLDLLPTAAAIAGVPLPNRKLDGYNILPVLKENKTIDRKAFMFYRGDLVFAVRDGNWKAHFITQTAYPNGPLEYQDPPLLYNLNEDPEERFNVASKYPEIIEKITTLKTEHEKTIVTTKKPAIEAEDLLSVAAVTGGSLRVQKMSGKSWSGGAQLWWVDAQPGDKLTIPIEIKDAGTYEVYGFFTRAKDYGIIQSYINDQALGTLIDGYANALEYSGSLLIGKTSLHAGKNMVTFKLVGKDIRSAGFSNGYLVGIDGMLLRKIN